MNRHQLYTPACAVLLHLTLAPAVHAELVAYDGFDAYTATNNLNDNSGGTGWLGDWSAELGHVTVQSKTLADTNAIVNGGTQAVRSQPTANLADASSYISRALPDTTGTLYMSLLIRHETGIASDDFINFQVSDGATGNTPNALGVGIRNAAGNPFFARAGSSSSGITDNALTNAAIDTTYLVVAKFSKVSSANYNRTDLYINPTSTTEPVFADATATFAGTGIDTLSLFSIRNFQPEQGDTFFFDELRFATTFEEALVPEPSSLALLALGGLALIRRRRA